MSDDPGYFLSHSIGQYPGKGADMAAALAEFTRVWAAPDDRQWAAALAARLAFLGLWSRLIDAPEGSLTTTESVTAGLHAVLTGLPPDLLAGRRVLVGADCFPSLHFLLAGLAGRHGFTLETVPMRDGEMWVREEDVLARLGGDVALTLVTQVTSVAGYRADLNALLPAARDAGSLVALDVTQGIGVVPFSLRDHAPDIVVSTSLKWLCGAPGAGIVQVRPDLLGSLRPELRGWFSQPDPFAWDLGGFAYAPDARRLDAGTPSPLAAIASVPALRRIVGGDAGQRLENAQGLCDAILAAAPGLGLAAVAPTDPARRGGSAMLRLPEGADAGGIVAGLRQAGLYADARGPVLRLSPGETTRAHHVDRLLARLADLV